MPITLGPLLLQDGGDLVSTQNTTVTISTCRFTGSSVSEQAFFHTQACLGPKVLHYSECLVNRVKGVRLRLASMLMFL